MGGIVDICNRALTKIGEDRIIAITDNSKQAKACNHAYEFVRDSVLRMHPWNCTVTRVQLAPLVTTPAFTYTYEYQIPSDCLKVLEVDTTYPWVVEGRKILTDEGTVLKVRYQKRETDPNQYDALLFEAIASKLAYELAEPLTQSNSKKDAALKDLTLVMESARFHDAQEGSPSTFKEDDWVNVRY